MAVSRLPDPIGKIETAMLKRIALAFLLLGTVVAAGTVSAAPAFAKTEPPDPC
jgi:hypothetical protein